MSEYKEKYNSIIKSGNSQQLITWLRTLDVKTRHTLDMLVKKDVKRLHTYEDLGDGRGWGVAGTSNQLDMLGIAMFCCYSRADLLRNTTDLVYRNNILDRILGWYCPEWFSDFVNGAIQKAHQLGRAYIKYERLAEWLDSEYLDRQILSDESIAYTLRPECESLVKYSFTLDEHIWLIFHYPPYLSTRWLEPFKVYTQNQRIDRFRVLKESLLAVNRNFNREQTCWFATLFNELQPTEEECIQLQDELFAAFACPQSKPVSTALAAIKTVVDHPQFRVDEFTAQLPLLFASPGKGVITTSLAVTDKIAAKKTELRAEVSRYICGVFLNKDVGLQTKAAKLLVKYGDATDPELSALLMDYADNLLVAARELLTDFLDVQPAMNEEAEETFLQPLIREDNRIVEPQSWEDFVFLAGQAFLNQESWHFDLLPAAVLRFDSLIAEDNVAQLEPAFAQAWKILGSECSFDGMLASFFLQYAGQLVERFPQQTKKIRSFYEKHQQKVKGGERAPTLIWGLFAFQKEAKIRLRPWIEWLSWVLKHLKTHAGLPLLSTPTHSPCFIEPSILVERFYQYQQAGVEPCSQDVQLALQRCAFTAESPSTGKLSGEYGALMRYMLSGDRHAVAQISHDDWKLAAIITRSTAEPDAASTATASALLEKKSLPSELISNTFPWHIAQLIKNYSGQEYIFQEFQFTFKDDWRQADGQLFYADSFMPCPNYSEDYGVYKRRTLFSMPWQPDGTLMRFIAMNFHCVYNATIKSNLEILQALFDLPLPLTPMGHLMIALSLLHSDKTVRSLAGELWMDKCRRPDGVNSAVIGDALGRLEAQGWAPLKRFTDLAMQSLMGVSARHNAALLEMVNAMASHLDGVKISNYKKLVELRQELTRM